MEVMDHHKICGPISRMEKGRWMDELSQQGIVISDIGKGSPEIELLIGSDYYPKILTGKKHTLQNRLTALETLFGWTLSGRLDNSRCGNVAREVTSMLVSSFTVNELWDLDTLGLKDPAESRTRAERAKETKEHFLETVTRNQEGRYCVKLPRIGGVQKIPDNFAMALKRLQASTSKLSKSDKVRDYQKVFEDWLEEGIVEEVSEGNSMGNRHFLPHRPVFNPKSVTTPIRPVFDASCKTGLTPSLNDCLEKGPNLLELLPSILARFREKKIGVTSDIRKAFQMIEMHEEDQNYLSFLWWEDSSTKKVKVFRHKRVVFGVNCSPFLLSAVIEFHLSQMDQNRKSTAEKLLKSLYVDNCVTSLDSFEEFLDFKEEATKMMAEAKMELRQWEPGKDGKVRVARVKTRTGDWIRPVQRLYPLEVSSTAVLPPMSDGVKRVAVEEARKMAQNAETVKHTRLGRRVKPPQKYIP